MYELEQFEKQKAEVKDEIRGEIDSESSSYSFVDEEKSFAVKDLDSNVQSPIRMNVVSPIRINELSPDVNNSLLSSQIEVYQKNLFEAGNPSPYHTSLLNSQQIERL